MRAFWRGALAVVESLWSTERQLERAQRLVSEYSALTDSLRARLAEVTEERDAYRAAVFAECEACAKLCQDEADAPDRCRGWTGEQKRAAGVLARKIRARGERR